MPTFRGEVEGAYELIEGALSQVTVNGVALRYLDRLPKIAVALGQPLSGPGRPANRGALLRILKRALSKFHEDKRAIAKARGEEISEFTEWMRAMVEQALLVAKEAPEEGDVPENPRLIQFQINHNFSVFRVHAHPFARVQFSLRPFARVHFSLRPFTSLHPCVSFPILASMRASFRVPRIRGSAQ